MGDEGGLSSRALQCFIEREIGNVRVHFEQMFRDRDKQVDIAFEEMKRYRDEIAKATEDRRKHDASFYSKEQHDAFALELTRDLNRIRDSVVEIKKPKYWWVGGLMLLVAVASGIWYLSEDLTRIDVNQKAVISTLQDHLKQTADHMHLPPPKP